MSEQKRINLAVLSSRLQEILKRPSFSAETSWLNVLIKFKEAQALEKFVADPSTVLSRVGIPLANFKLERSIPELKYVSARILGTSLPDFSVVADQLGVSIIDENTTVKALLGPQASRGLKASRATGGAALRFASVRAAASFGLTGKGVRVAVVDSGIDSHHPDLEGRVAEHRDFTGEGLGDLSGHGSHVAGIVVGAGHIDPSRRALAWEAELVEVKVLTRDGWGQTDWILEGIVWAVKVAKANLLSLSLGASGDFDATEPLSEAVTWAVAQGVPTFVAAGNCGPTGSELGCTKLGAKSITSPGVCPAAITVGAAEAQQVAGFSSRGPTLKGLIKPDLLAPGVDIVSLRAKGISFGRIVDDYYTTASGTSMATPACTAVAALLLEASRRESVPLGPEDIRQLLQESAKALPEIPETWQGAGLIDATEALSLFYSKKVGPRPSPGPSVPAPVVSLELVEPGWLRAGQRTEARLTVSNPGTAPLYKLQVSLGGRSIEPTGQSNTVLDLAELGPSTSATATCWLAPEQGGTLTVVMLTSYQTTANGQPVRLSVPASFEVLPTMQVDAARLDEVIRRARTLLLEAQNSDGTWTGKIMFNAWPTGMYCILYKLLGLPGAPTECLHWLETHRLGLNDEGVPDGTFGIIDPPSLHFVEATVVSQIALEIWGRPRDQRAWDYLMTISQERLSHVISQCDPFTQLFCALASEYRPAGTSEYFSIHDMLIMPLALVAIPSFMDESIAKLFGAWGQDGIVALGIIGTLKTQRAPSMLHRLLLAKAERTLLSRQCANGSWYCTILPTFAAVLALHTLGYSTEHPVLKRALEFMRFLQSPNGYVTRFALPVWDTSLSIVVLREAGIPADHPRLIRGADYLLECPTPEGGIPFQKENVPYPDTDDTAFAILALNAVDHPARNRKAEVIANGLRWLLFMQGKTGGWAAFAKDQGVKSPERVPLFKDDPPTVDVTGHVLSCFKVVAPYEVGRRIPDARRMAFDWLRGQQLDTGGFYGRWGMTVTYGTGAFLQAVGDLGEPVDQPMVTEAIQYLLHAQKPDGGWGEGVRTYYDVSAHEDVPSTVEQTAWSLVGLLSVPLTPESREAVERGLAFLLSRFDEQRGFGEGDYTVGAIWVYRNSLYPLIWPLWALVKYQAVLRSES